MTQWQPSGKAPEKPVPLPFPPKPAEPSNIVVGSGQEKATALDTPTPVPPMAPMQSTTIRALLLVGASQLLLQTIPMLQAHAFDPWALGITVVTIGAGILVRLGASDVQAPAVLGFLNRTTP
jgi:hypothetical protein